MRTKPLAKNRNDRLWFEDDEAAIFLHPKRGPLAVITYGMQEFRHVLLYFVEEIVTGLRYPVDAKDLRKPPSKAEIARLIELAKDRGESRHGPHPEHNTYAPYPNVPNLEAS